MTNANATFSARLCDIRQVALPVYRSLISPAMPKNYLELINYQPIYAENVVTNDDRTM